MTAVTRWIPEGAEERQVTGGVVYTTVCKRNGRPWAVGYRGKAGRPAFNYSFPTADRMNEYIEGWARDNAATEAAKKARADARNSFQHDLKVGEILTGSWGYEQTNREFYEVTAVRGKIVEIREIGQEQVSGGPSEMAGNFMPLPGNYAGEAVKRRVMPGNMVKLESYIWLNRWNGRPQHATWYG